MARAGEQGAAGNQREERDRTGGKDRWTRELASKHKVLRCAGFRRSYSVELKKEFPRGGAEMLLNPNIRIGCSGWQYTHWRGDFCPAELAPADWLAYHAQRVETVEINHTFYRLLEASTFASWAPRAPRGFVHAVKAGCYLTHMKTLKDRSGVVSTAAAVAVNLEGLDTLLRALPRRRRHAIEFREPSWYCDEDFALP